MKTEYITASLQDIECLIDLMRLYYEHDEIQFDECIARQNALELLKSDKNGIALLIQQDNTAIGYIVVTFGFGLEHGSNGTIDEFFILPGYRGQGLGVKTLNYIESLLAEKGIKAIHTEVEIKNKHGMNFWIKNGYQSTDRKSLTKTIETPNNPA